MGSTHDAHGSSPLNTSNQPGPGRRPRNPAKNGTASHDNLPIKNEPPSTASKEQARKRKRSRKGLDKRFDCTFEGCGKNYSRAEHLYRHELNHSLKHIFRCEYPDCPRTFVRGDLLKRHMERHTAKGSQLNRRDSMASLAARTVSPHSASPDINRAPMFNDPRQAQAQLQVQTQTNNTHNHSPQQHSPHTFTPVTSAPSTTFHTTGPVAGHNAYASSSTHGALPHQRAIVDQSSNTPPAGQTRPSIQTHVGPFGVMSPASSQQDYHGHNNHTPQSAGFVPQQQVMPFNLPPAQYSQYPTTTAPGDGTPTYATTTSAEFPHANEMAMLDHMAMQSAGTVFGEEGLNKSPYVGMPEDFMAYLFNSLPPHGSPAPQALPPPLLNYGDLNNQYSATNLGENGALTFFPAQPQQVMAVNNLLDQDAPEASITEERSQEIFNFICERFQATEDASSQRRRDSVLGGDRSAGDHMLSRRMMQAYISSYWYHFSDQMPILHKPTFNSERTPNPLLIAIMAIGAACLDRTHGASVTRAGAKVSNFLAEHLRWEIFMDPSFRPPAKLWVFQTLILLELYEKMYSTRELHERAHIHHATTITLMRRGRSLIGKSQMDSPPNIRDSGEGSRKSSSSGMAHTPDEWWNHWITNEATRRAAFAAFVIDSTHATMFGHSATMVAHEMRLPLPCDESLWKASSSAEVGRVEGNLMSRGIKPISFLEGLKRTLSNHEVRTTTFGRTVLMAGLLSVTYHMHQRDLQVNILGGGVIQALGGRDKWRATLTRAYDCWKSDFDAALDQSEHSSDPYHHDEARHEFNTIVESRTVLHHLAHMAMHADIVDCQIFARAKRLLGRSIGPHEFGSAQRRIKDFWAPSARARDAAYYALKFLCSVLVPKQPESQHDAASHQIKPYDTREDDLLNRPWVLYFAALVVWCYGFAIEGPCPEVEGPVTQQEKWQQTRAYLTKYGSITDPNELREMRGLNNTTALLMVLKDSFENSRWELLHEAGSLLHNCIVLNYGSNI
ncbi:Zinc finger domain containing protein [Cladobotryum mycophilum]|uniref:Zinc finger domain containing protein n=1 Tax=Cladobotryum mycophilum TaxID=491253 RepID=A0ABR0T3P2_9HYPO